MFANCLQDLPIQQFPTSFDHSGQIACIATYTHHSGDNSLIHSLCRVIFVDEQLMNHSWMTQSTEAMWRCLTPLISTNTNYFFMLSFYSLGCQLVQRVHFIEWYWGRVTIEIDFFIFFSFSARPVYLGHVVGQQLHV